MNVRKAGVGAAAVGVALLLAANPARADVTAKTDAATRTVPVAARATRPAGLFTASETLVEGINTKRIIFTEQAWKGRFALDLSETAKGQDYRLFYGVPAGDGMTLSLAAGKGDWWGVGLAQALKDGRIVMSYEDSPTKQAVMLALDRKMSRKFNLSAKYANTNGTNTLIAGIDYQFAKKWQAGISASLFEGFEPEGMKPSAYLMRQIAKDVVAELRVNNIGGQETYTFAVDFALK